METLVDIFDDMGRRIENATRIATSKPEATSHVEAVAEMLKDFKERLEAAYEREVRKESDAMIDIIGDGVDVALELKKRVELLERVVKPVIECRLENEICAADEATSHGDSMSAVLRISVWQDMSRAVHSVREAQRIMREGVHS